MSEPPRELVASIAQLVPEAAPESVGEFLSRLDAEYWERESADDIASHFRLSVTLGRERPARVAVVARDAGRYDVVVVAFDYFAEFSILCGLLAVHGLNIESGHVHTFAPAAAAHGRRPPARKIVDVFRVFPRPGRAAPDARALEEELVALLTRVVEGRSLEARDELNRRLVETMERLPGPPARLPPLEIAFDNDASPQWTVMDVRGGDAPAFLYALANALSMRGVYVQQVQIETHGDTVRDRFYVANREGRKLVGEAEQQTLRLAVAFIQQFTSYLTSAPDPALALRDFDQLLDRVMAEGATGETLELLQSAEGLRQLARLLGSSAFLWEDFLRTQFEHLRPVLAEWTTREIPDRAGFLEALRLRLREAGDYEECRRRLNEFKDEQMLLVDMKQLLDPRASLEVFSRSLTDLAEVVLGEALRLGRERLLATHGTPRDENGGECPFAVFGLGKFGGIEMGYASDIELLCVYGGSGQTEKTGIENGDFSEALVKEILGLIEARQDGIFHIDLRLRPYGRKGALASPLSALRDYYREGGEAAPFERQALIKLRFVAGDATLGGEVEAIRDRFVWSGAPWDMSTALHLRDRQVKELVPLGRTNVKLSRGGLVEIEYAVQYLQILHGREQPELRSGSTLSALAALRKLGLVSEAEHQDLERAYVFWRRVADALRMVRGHAGDLLLPEEDSEELRFLARRLGYGGSDWEEGARSLLKDVRLHRERVASFFDRHFRGGEKIR
jgi:glutamate-ammonia-ligase adenylyltransferase